MLGKSLENIIITPSLQSTDNRKTHTKIGIILCCCFFSGLQKLKTYEKTARSTVFIEMAKSSIGHQMVTFQYRSITRAPVLYKLLLIRQTTLAFYIYTVLHCASSLYNYLKICRLFVIGETVSLNVGGSSVPISLWKSLPRLL